MKVGHKTRHGRRRKPAGHRQHRTGKARSGLNRRSVVDRRRALQEAREDPYALRGPLYPPFPIGRERLP